MPISARWIKPDIERLLKQKQLQASDYWRILLKKIIEQYVNLISGDVPGCGTV
jgi:hypothetical protein